MYVLRSSLCFDWGFNGCLSIEEWWCTPLILVEAGETLILRPAWFALSKPWSRLTNKTPYKETFFKKKKVSFFDILRFVQALGDHCGIFKSNDLTVSIDKFFWKLNNSCPNQECLCGILLL